MMYTKILFLTITLFIITSKSQPGGGDMQGPPDDGGDATDMQGPDSTPAGDCDVNGATSTYSETIDGELRLISASGCPNHYSECTGKNGECIEGETEASITNITVNIPAYPCFNNYTDDSEYNWNGYPVYCLLDNLGIMLNGVSIFSPTADQTCRDAIGQESESFDTCGGHAGPTGAYHYHAAPACLLDQVGDRVDTNPDGHSPQIGWAYDGFPVYGPHGLDGEYILLCTQNNSNSSDCLDNCSGHSHHTIDGFKYHYHVAGPVGDLETSPLYPTPTSDRFPYTFGCFKGIPSDWTQTTVNPVPELQCAEPGYTDDYVPKPVDGITDIFYYPAQDDTDTDATTMAPTTVDSDSTPSPTTVDSDKPTTTEVDTNSTPSPTSSNTNQDDESVHITGWIYADSWFELYFNGEKILTDTISTIPNNAMYVNFTAPIDGTYSFAIWAGTSVTVTEETGEWCAGDGGITIALSDGTVSSSDWKCTVVMEGPLETACQADCIDMDVMPSDCTIEYNDYADCWSESFCPEATMRWSSAIEYTTDEVGWGISPNSSSYDYPNVCSGLDATSTEQIYIDEGCVPSEKNWGDAVPIWTDDLDLHNTIICRYGYTVQSTSAPGTTEEDTDIQNTMDNEADELFRFYALIVTIIGSIMI